MHASSPFHDKHNENLFAATIMHMSVEIPFFVFPVILLLIGQDLVKELGDLSWIGLGSLGTMGTLAAGLPSPLFGILADKYRRGLMMTISVILGAFAALLIGLFGDSFLVLMSGIILLGLALSLYHPPGLAFVSSSLDNQNIENHKKSKLNKTLALHGIGGGFGASIGPISVYFFLSIMKITDWKQIYVFWFFPLLLMGILFWFIVGKNEDHLKIEKPSKQVVINNKSIIQNKKFRIFAIIYLFMILMSLSRGMINFVLSPFLSEIKNVKLAEAALFIGISTLIGSIGQLLGGSLGDKFGEKYVLSIAGLGQAVVIGLIFMVTGELPLFILYLILGITVAFFWPSTNSLVAKHSKNRGTAFGMVMLVANIIGAIGPSIDGIFLTIDSTYQLIFVFSSVFAFIGFIVLLFLNENKNEALSS